MGRKCPIHDRLAAYPEMLADGGLAKHEDIEAVETVAPGCTVYARVLRPRDPKQDRFQLRAGDSAFIIRWRAQVATDAAKAICKERAATADWVNAQTRNRGLVRLLIGGLRKIRGRRWGKERARNLPRGGATPTAEVRASWADPNGHERLQRPPQPLSEKRSVRGQPSTH